MGSSKKTILIVDDDESIVELLAELLVQEGYAVVTANNGKSGLEILKSEKPQLVLLDVNMPVMDGWEFKKSKDSDGDLKKIPLFIITAQHELPQAGDVSYIPKPININFLLEQIKKFV